MARVFVFSVALLFGLDSLADRLKPLIVDEMASDEGNFCTIASNKLICWDQWHENFGDPLIPKRLATPDLINPIKVDVSGISACALDEKGIHCWRWKKDGSMETGFSGQFFITSNPDDIANGSWNQFQPLVRPDEVLGFSIVKDSSYPWSDLCILQKEEVIIKLPRIKERILPKFYCLRNIGGVFKQELAGPFQIRSDTGTNPKVFPVTFKYGDYRRIPVLSNQDSLSHYYNSGNSRASTPKGLNAEILNEASQVQFVGIFGHRHSRIIFSNGDQLSIYDSNYQSTFTVRSVELGLKKDSSIKEFAHLGTDHLIVHGSRGEVVSVIYSIEDSNGDRIKIIKSPYNKVFPENMGKVIKIFPYERAKFGSFWEKNSFCASTHEGLFCRELKSSNEFDFAPVPPELVRQADPKFDFFDASKPIATQECSIQMNGPEPDKMEQFRLSKRGWSVNSKFSKKQFKFNNGCVESGMYPRNIKCRDSYDAFVTIEFVLNSLINGESIGFGKKTYDVCSFESKIEADCQSRAQRENYNDLPNCSDI